MATEKEIDQRDATASQRTPKIGGQLQKLGRNKERVNQNLRGSITLLTLWFHTHLHNFEKMNFYSFNVPSLWYFVTEVAENAHMPLIH